MITKIYHFFIKCQFFLTFCLHFCGFNVDKSIKKKEYLIIYVFVFLFLSFFVMKKILSFVLWGAIAWVLACWLASADQDISKELVECTESRWYDSNKQLSVKEINTDSIVFKSPAIKNDVDEDVTDYVLLYWEKSIDVLADDISAIDDFVEVEMSAEISNGEVEFTLSKLEQYNLNQDKLYYLVAIPRDDYWFYWCKSNEICFKLWDKSVWSGLDCENSSPVSNNTANSWKSALDLANVSCTWDWKRLTINWVPSNVWNVYISLYNERTSNFDRKWTVNVSNDRTFSFDVTQNTEPTVRFDDTEWLQAYKTYVCHSLQTKDPSTPQKTWTTSTITKVPTVWPKENALAVVIGAVVLYLIYSVVRRKAN